jgi:hypothetical protein
VVAYFRVLSAGVRCSWFRHPVSEPWSQLVRELTQVDQANHVAFVAEVPASGRKIAVGKARYVRAASSCSAEISISIADRWQGLGRSMLAWLEQHAADAGVRRLTGRDPGSQPKDAMSTRKDAVSSQQCGIHDFRQLRPSRCKASQENPGACMMLPAPAGRPVAKNGRR